MPIDDHSWTNRSDRLFIVVARNPVPGETKTRLGSAIGMENAAALHRAFLTDLAERFTPRNDEPGDYDFAWAFTPPDAPFELVIRDVFPLADTRAMRFVPQFGSDLSTRLTHLFRWGTDQGYARISIMASDSPQLPFNIAGTSFALLEDRDLILGRVEDGGYYLIGMRGFHDVVNTHGMGTGDAATALVESALGSGLRVGELDRSYDVDTVDDLKTLIADLWPDGVKAPATWNALNRLGLLEHG